MSCATVEGMTDMEKHRRRVNTFNKVVAGLQRMGIVFGPVQMLTVTGRKSGQPRTFAIAVVSVGGDRYIFQAFPKAAWVTNARAARLLRAWTARASWPTRSPSRPSAACSADASPRARGRRPARGRRHCR